MRQLIKKIIKEQKEQDLSSAIKELLNNSIGPKYKGIICKFDAVAPWKMYNDPINRDYQVMVSVIGGVGSNRWPNTMNFVKERDKIVNETWHTVYNYMGLSTDVFLRNVKSCDEVMSEGLHDTSWQNDEGDKITLIDLLDATEKIPVRNISVDKIKPKLLTWDDDDEEIAKIEKSDLQYPILIFVDDEGNFISIIDGHHRAQKAVKHKLKSIKAKLIPINSLPKNIKKVFKHLNKKGESLNESKMLDYLKQFLSGEVLDNYKKEKGRKEFQKMVDMVYKITAKDTPIEGMVVVLVGHIDKNMWGTTYTDPNSVGSRWDFKVILKPLFTNYNPNNEQDYNDRVLKFEEDFTRNARGMGFEVISPIQHNKVKDYKVTFEWASRLDVKEI